MLDTVRPRPWPGLAGACEVCRAWTGGSLCLPCRQRFAAPQVRCEGCALRLGPVQGQGPGVLRCGACVQHPPPFQRSLCVADYDFPWDRLIARFKYEQTPELAGLLASCLADAAGQAQVAQPQLFVPVPLSSRRLAERGYDQAWELARRLGRLLQVPARSDLIERRFDGRHQADLSRAQRLSNLQGAFAVTAAGRSTLVGRHLALVDDVMTTGATAHEVTRALRAAGAAQVDLYVVARTPAPADPH